MWTGAVGKVEQKEIEDGFEGVKCLWRQKTNPKGSFGLHMHGQSETTCFYAGRHVAPQLPSDPVNNRCNTYDQTIGIQMV